MSTQPDLYYRPPADALHWAQSFAPSSALVIGNSTDQLAVSLREIGVDDARSFDAAILRRTLHDGTYLFSQDGEWQLVVVNGSKPATTASDDRMVVCSTHLGEAYYAREENWSNSLPLLDESPIKIGQLVRPISSSGWGTVRSVARHATGHSAQVEVGDRLRTFDVDDLQLLLGDHRDPKFWLSLGPAAGSGLLGTLSWLKLDTPLSDTLYSYASTKTTFKPYQFIPVLKMLASATGRILIADEVGLGKTIEAGLIWTEIEQRHPVRRALVIVPAALKLKWRQEMERRFIRTLRELKADDLREFVEDIRADKDPELIGVVSLETLRSADDVLVAFAELAPRFDIVIVDEAHSLRNSRSKSHFVGSLMADLAEHLVFLSATPLNLGTDDLFNLINLLDEGGFPDPAIFKEQLAPNVALNAIARNMASATQRSRTAALSELTGITHTAHGRALAARPDFQRLKEILELEAPVTHDEVARVKRLVGDLNTMGSVFSRTRKVDVPDKKAVREVEEIEVLWTEQERALYDAIYKYSADRALATNMPLGFTMQMPLRQACSSLVVAQSRIAARESWRPSSDDDNASNVISWEEEVEADDNDPDALNRIRLSHLLSHDSKLEALRDRLRIARRNGMKQALIFSFFRGTVEYLAKQLGSELATGYLHGGVKVESRGDILDRFRSGDIDILISNQVGSEGLDFEFCNVLVNYDLPWNPMQVEQRIGRLDRFGQKSDKIFIFNLKTSGTIETDIFGRLYDRIGLFEQSIGDLEPIMRSTTDKLRAILDPRLSETERNEQIDRFAVASATQRADIKKLEESNGILASMSLLDIEGITSDGPASGRYVGAAELKSLLVPLLERYDGAFEATLDDSLFRIRGSDDLARALGRLKNRNGSMHGLGRLATLLRDTLGTGLIATFDPHYEAISSVELITVRHPLIRLAVEDMGQRREQLPRFGILRSQSQPRGSLVLASVDLARSEGGVHSTTELWVTAIDVATGDLQPQASENLLVELAEGTLEAPDAQAVPMLSAQLARVTAMVNERRRREQAERSQENEALVQARIASEQRSVGIKIRRVDERRAKMSESADLRLRRMLEGQARNLRQDLDDGAAKYEARRRLTLSVETVALVLLEGPA